MWQLGVLGLYLAVLLPLAVYGLHRQWMLYWFRRTAPTPVTPSLTDWPFVTVQLPVFNERYVVDRLLEAVATLDYPIDRFEIQLLDDSTDDTTEIAARAVARLREAGLDATMIHRDVRTGFKAGALEHGMRSARGELIAIFDADFVPPADFLRRTVPWVRDRVGMAQARWGYLNTDTWLTSAQATLLDGHFVVEHAARHRAGCWFNFNGTAGVWRRRAIEEAGGWQHDTLTEDLDLSYRAQLAGWDFVYLSDLVAPAEVPQTMAAFQAQQRRWAKGSMQVAKKLLGRIWRAPVPVKIKLEATAHLTANLAYPLAALLALLVPFAVVARGHDAPWPLLALDLFLFLGATASIAQFYGVAIRASGAPGGVGRLLRLPLVLSLGLGMAVSQTRAVYSGLFGEVGSFVRTPKSGSSSPSGYLSRIHGLLLIELVLAAWLSFAVVAAMVGGYWASVPFLGMFAVGYGTVALKSLHEALTDAADLWDPLGVVRRLRGFLVARRARMARS